MIGVDPAMFELFREEVRTHTDTLANGLVQLEADPANPQRIEPLMRAAHSLKGAARIVGIDPAVRLAHVMEDALVAAQTGKVRITPADIDQLLKGTDLLAGLANLTPGTTGDWAATNEPAVTALEPVFRAMATGQAAPPVVTVKETPPVTTDRESPPIAMGGLSPTIPPPPDTPPADIPAEPFDLPAGHTMLDRFREESRGHLLALSQAIEALPAPLPDNALEAVRQIRGAARIMKCWPVESTAVALGGFLTALRDTRVSPSPEAAGWVRHTAATLAGLLATDEETYPAWVELAAEPLKVACEVLQAAVQVTPQKPPPRVEARPEPQPIIVEASPQPVAPVVPTTTPEPEPAPAAPPAEAVVRVTAGSLNRLMGLAGESLVQGRWLQHFSNSLLKLKKRHDQLADLLDGMTHLSGGGGSADEIARASADVRHMVGVVRQELADQGIDFDEHAARAEDLNSRLYREVIVSRMRPFADGVHGLPRLVRDMARSLGKKARLEIRGETTDVDRDVLEKLESPLSHLIRNAVDHGLEMPEVRTAAGKPEAGTIRLEAWHRAGMLSLTVADDGRGVDLEKLRKKIVDRGLNTTEVVRQMTEAELLEFLFLPGFSTAAQVTEFSGRGVGLDVVHDTVRRIGGSVRVSSKPGAGTTFHLQLPITLSVIRAVVVEVAGEPYAFPHTRIDRLLRVPRETVRSLEHRQFIVVDGQNIGLVLAGQLLDLPAEPPKESHLPVVLLSDATGTYGLVVDAIHGEQDLVVRPLDPRLGKVPNLSAAAILDDGTPVLIADVEDLVRSMDQFIQSGTLRRCEPRDLGPARKKRVLVVDDSITVREVERQLLLHKGYDVTVAVDGMDGWNQVRAGHFDLLVSDVDMPRMSGLQLVAAVRGQEEFRHLPIIIVSYKEREEDRIRGLEVGANAYLTKSAFHDNRFVEAVEDLIGPA